MGLRRYQWQGCRRTSADPRLVASPRWPGAASRSKELVVTVGQSNKHMVSGFSWRAIGGVRRFGIGGTRTVGDTLVGVRSRKAFRSEQPGQSDRLQGLSNKILSPFQG